MRRRMRGRDGPVEGLEFRVLGTGDRV